MNQSPPFVDVNLYLSDRPLRDAAARAGATPAQEAEHAAFGAAWGSGEMADLGRCANESPPRLRAVDPRGERLDVVECHPAYHGLMARSLSAGLHASTWDAAASHPLEGRPHPSGAALRAARFYMATQVESGHLCPVTMTHASVAALAAAPDALSRWLPRIVGRAYDPAFRPWWEKGAVTLGMGMTERQGGTDVRANITSAAPAGDHHRISGQKWFMSAPMCDAFLVLAQAAGGLTCFLVPRFEPDGRQNGLRFQRLKDKLGNRSNASSEVVFEMAYGERIGPEGKGVATIIEMVQLTRLDCAVSSAGLMRMGLAHAVHHARHRTVFQRKLIDQPLMRATLADMALEVEAAVALVMRLARAFDAAAHDPAEAAYARLVTPAAKYLVCKQAPHLLYEAMECLGGNGYVEEFPLARAYREAPVNAIWEGSGNVMALDVLRAASREPEGTESLLASLGQAGGSAGEILARRLADGLRRPGAEALGRRFTEGLSRLAALAALAEGDGGVADAYAARLLASGGEPRLSSWGADGLVPNADALIERVLPE
ncbi:DNA alkylation response protein [Alsobacter soli]|uniref:DNA alkylation response protein n=1 Tax=Alsobacter soli TaxID=2109933 RepID=A0A2T1HPD7_9HYPH|nr:acyl-CoA dehydrogenase family protein [Alsobacter soli]PSC03520.1 DNA alkylation response protein [Alsobacter soli]